MCVCAHTLARIYVCVRNLELLMCPVCVCVPQLVVVPVPLWEHDRSAMCYSLSVNSVWRRICVHT